MQYKKLYLHILIVSGVIAFSAMGIRQSFGILTIPYTELSGETRQWFGLAVALQNLMWGICSPIFGGIADRYGIYRVVLMGLVCYIIGLLLMALAGQWSFFFGQLIFGAGIAGAGMSIGISAVSKVCSPEKRSLAIGIVTAASSFGQFLFVPIGSFIFAHWGWVVMLVVMALYALCLIPTYRTFKSIPPANQSTTLSVQAVLKGACQYPSFILLILGFFVCGFQLVFISTHLVAFLSDMNINASSASLALALIGLFNIVGTLLFGWLGNQYSKRLLLTMLYLARSIVIALFIFTPITATTAILFGMALGLLWLGTVPLTSGLVATFFGTRYLTMLYGVVFLSHQLGSFMGAWLGGYLYQVYGSYDIVWYLSIAFGVITAIVHLPIKEVKFPALYANHR